MYLYSKGTYYLIYTYTEICRVYLFSSEQFDQTKCREENSHHGLSNIANNFHIRIAFLVYVIMDIFVIRILCKQLVTCCSVSQRGWSQVLYWRGAVLSNPFWWKSTILSNVGNLRADIKIDFVWCWGAPVAVCSLKHLSSFWSLLVVYWFPKWQSSVGVENQINGFDVENEVFD